MSREEPSSAQPPFVDSPPSGPPVIDPPPIEPRAAKVSSLAGSVRWMFVALFGSIVFAYFWVDVDRNFFFVVGECFGSALFAWVVFHFAVARRRGWRFSVLALVVIFVGVMPTGLFLYAHRKAELAQMSAMFERDMRALVEASRSSGVAKELPEGEVRGGDLGKIEKLLRDYINQAIRAGNEYQETFEHSGFNRILDPQRLAQDSTLAESRTILKRVRETMSTFQQQLDGLPESLRKDAERLDVSPRFKREFLAGYQRGLEEGNTRSVKLVALQREALGEYEQIIDLLEQTKGSWMIRDGHIEFASEATLSLINAHVDAIGKIEERQTALQSEMFDKLETNIQNLRR